MEKEKLQKDMRGEALQHKEKSNKVQMGIFDIGFQDGARKFKIDKSSATYTDY